MRRSPVHRVCIWLACLALSAPVSGCASIVEEGLRRVVGQEEASASRAPAPLPHRAYGTPDRDGRPPEESELRPASAARTIYQVAPTHDWAYGTGPRPFTPSSSLFDPMAPGRVSCRPVPVGLARLYSGEVGPAASPLVNLGPLGLGIAGPDGAVEGTSATSRWEVSVRGLRSGARMAGEGGLCSNRIFFYVRIGHTPDPFPAHL